MIRFTCPNCHEKFKVDAKHAGRKTKCSSCEQLIQVPEINGLTTDLFPTQDSPHSTTVSSNTESPVGFFARKFARVEGIVVKVESRVASIGSNGLGAGFSVPIEELGVSVGTGLQASKSKVRHESVVWVKQEDQNEIRFVFESEIFPCREGNRIAIGSIGSGVLIAKNFATHQKVLINKPESFYKISPPDYRGRFYALLGVFFMVWIFSLVIMAARSAPYGTYKPPISQAIDNGLAFFVCLSPLLAPIVIFVFASRRSREYYKLEYRKQAKEIGDIISDF